MEENKKQAPAPLTEEQLLSKEAQLNEREAELDAREEHLAERELALDQEPTIQMPEPGLEFEFEGKKYKFSDSAPKNILFHGKSVSQKDLAKDEDSLLQLIGAKSSLITKL